MLTRLAENLYCQTVPLPNNPLRELNAYILTGERNLLIDTGFNRPECLEALRGAFRELGIEKTDLFITHLHSDHCGLMGHFLSEGSTIYAGETDGELINFEAGNLYWRMLDDLFIKYGFPKADFGRNTDIHPGRKYCHETRVNFTYVTEEDVLDYGGYHLRPVETPGHTPGSVTLRAENVLFTGDTLFAGSMGRTDLPGGNEMDLRFSLRRLGELEGDYHILPGHEGPSTLERERQTNYCVRMAMGG